MERKKRGGKKRRERRGSEKERDRDRWGSEWVIERGRLLKRECE